MNKLVKRAAVVILSASGRQRDTWEATHLTLTMRAIVVKDYGPFWEPFRSAACLNPYADEFLRCRSMKERRQGGG